MPLEGGVRAPYFVTKAPEGAMANPIQFVQQVRSEVSKVIWPTRREVAVTTLMVFLLTTLAAIFFFFVDWAIRNGLTLILGFFGN